MRILAETERLEGQLLALQRNQWYNRLLAASVDDEVRIAGTLPRPSARALCC